MTILTDNGQELSLEVEGLLFEEVKAGCWHVYFNDEACEYQDDDSWIRDAWSLLSELRGDLIFDVRNLDFCGTRFFGLLISLAQLAKNRQQNVVATGLHPEDKLAIQILHLESVLVIESDPDEAISKTRSQNIS